MDISARIKQLKSWNPKHQYGQEFLPAQAAKVGRGGVGRRGHTMMRTMGDRGLNKLLGKPDSRVAERDEAAGVPMQ